MLRAHLAVLPDMDLGIDYQHFISPKGVIGDT